MKKTSLLLLKFCSAMLLIFIASHAEAQETQVKITDIRSDKGKIVLNVFKDNASYDAEQPYKKLVFDKKGLVNGTLSLNCKLEPGIYGITLLDDENNNGKIDKNMIRMPKEGFGFSNFFMTKMKKPVFDDFKVDIKAPVSKINIKVKYM